MVGSSKILTVSYGTFSCTLEGFDDPFSAMKSIAEYFRDLAADDRYFGAEPPTPDAEMLHRIAEREVQRRVESRVHDDGIVLRQMTDETAERPVRPFAEPASPQASEPATEDARSAPSASPSTDESISARLARIRSVVQQSRAAAPGVAATAVYADGFEDEPADDSAPATEDYLDEAFEPEEGDAAPEGPSIEDMIAGTVAGADATVEDMADEFAAPPVAEDEAIDEETAEVEEPVEIADDGTSDEAFAEDEAEDASEPAMIAEPVLEDEADATEAEVEAEAEAMADEWTDDAEEATEAEEMAADAIEEFHEPDVEEPVSEMAEADAEDMDAPVIAQDEIADDIALAESAMASEPDTVAIEEIEDTAEAADDDEDDIVEATSEDEPSEKEAISAEADDEDEDEAPAPQTDLAARIIDLKTADAARGLLSDDDPDNQPDVAPEEKQARRQVLISDRPDSTPAFDRILEETNTKMAESEGTRRRSAIAHLKAAVAATKADRLLKREKPSDAEEQSRYREDLAKVVRPRPSEPRENAAEKAAEKSRQIDEAASDAPQPLMLVSSQRVDGGKVGPVDDDDMAVRPRRIGAGMLALETEAQDGDDDDTDFVAFAQSMGARDLPDLLEAAAAYTAFVERQPHFSRPQIMRRAAAIETDEEFTREAGLRSFGQLLRQGRIRKLQRGQFTIADTTRFNPEKRVAAGE